MKHFVLSLSLPCVALLLAAAPYANAATVSGTAYCDIQSNSGGQGSGYAIQAPTIGASLANAESTSAGVCATFTASSIGFGSGGDLGNSGTSLGNFLTDTSTTNEGGTTGLNATYSVTPAKNGSSTGSTATGSQSSDGTLLVLTGSTYLTAGESITLTHDDGAYIYVCATSSVCNSSTGAGYSTISGEPANSGTQTTADQSPFAYSGTTGAFNYVLIYDSNYEQPAELVSNINTAATPEPSSIALLGTGLLSVAGLVRRRFAA